MRKLTCVALSLAFLTTACDAQTDVAAPDGDRGTETKSFAIVGGSDAPIEAAPYQVALRWGTGPSFCGGTIVSPTWIVTAAHCVEDGLQGVLVFAGSARIDNSGQFRSVASFSVFPGYVTAERGKDVALIELNSPLDLSGPRARAIGIMTPELAALGYADPGRVATVTGWGTLSSNGATPDALQSVDVPIVSQAVAGQSYDGLTDDQLAAGAVGIGGRDACQGDSGGPLVVEGPGGAPVLAGVVSWGIGCGLPDYPGMYARVSSFSDWIVANVGTLTVPPIAQEPEPEPETPDTGSTPDSAPSVPTSGELARGEHVVLGPWDVSGGGLFEASLDGSGDPDLYLRFGASPTTSVFDCRSWKSGPVEDCLVEVPAGATEVYVMVHGYTASTWALEVEYAPDDVEPEPTPDATTTTAQASGTLSEGQTQRFEGIGVVPGTLFEAQLTGTGDADLYARCGSAPTEDAWDCRPYHNGSDERCELTCDSDAVHLMIVGYRAASYTLSVTYTPR